MTEPTDPVDELRRLLNTPSTQVGQKACAVFVNWFERLCAELIRAGVEPHEAENAALGVVSGVLDSFGHASGAAVQAVTKAAAESMRAVRH